MFKDLKLNSFVLFILLSCLVTYVAMADRGGFGRKNKIQLNITTFNTLKNSIGFNLKSNLIYKGNKLINQQKVGNSIFTNFVISYQKGNTIYLLPFKQKILIQSYSQSAGYKLIIRSK